MLETKVKVNSVVAEEGNSLETTEKPLAKPVLKPPPRLITKKRLKEATTRNSTV
jgi:hypothetical protein